MYQSVRVATIIQSMMIDPDFVTAHRRFSAAFTRQRKLTFGTLVATILQLAKRSLQIECNLLGERLMTESASKQAFSKARYKLSYTAFKAINDEMLKEVYQDSSEGLWRGYRVLGLDGSTIRLPDSLETERYFGRHNSSGFNKGKDPIIARISEVVDLTTNLVVNADIGPTCQGERAIAQEQITQVANFFKNIAHNQVLFVFDRGYVSRRWINMLLALETDFIFRIPRKFSNKVDELVNQGQSDALVQIEPDIPPLRLVVEELPAGEKCVLLTSLKNQDQISSKDIHKVYWQRWRGCEEGYKRQKVALELENFLGSGVEAILQEFWASIVVLNLFQLQCLDEEGPWDIDNPPKERINRSVIFGSLRDSLFKTIMGELSGQDLWAKFVIIARRSKVKVRPGRTYSRHGLKKEKHSYRRVC